MRKLLLIAFIIIISKAYSQCPTEAVVLASQSDVDLFATNYPTCDVLSFDLSIGKTDNTSSDITDLSPLSNLTSIGGFIYVHDNPGLTNLNGLSNLTSTGDIYIDNNTELTSLSALSGISKTSGYLEVFNNSKLTNLTGLTGVSSLTTGLYVGFNPFVVQFCRVRQSNRGWRVFMDRK